MSNDPREIQLEGGERVDDLDEELPPGFWLIGLCRDLFGSPEPLVVEREAEEERAT